MLPFLSEAYFTPEVKQSLFYAQHSLVWETFFIPLFPCDQTISWTMGKECDSSVYSYFRNAFIILWMTNNKTWCLLIKASSWWEGVKRIQSFLTGQLYFSQVWVLQSKTVGKRIFQDPKGYQLPTLHFFLASLSTFESIATCQKLRSLLPKWSSHQLLKNQQWLKALSFPSQGLWKMGNSFVKVGILKSHLKYVL